MNLAETAFVLAYIAALKRMSKGRHKIRPLRYVFDCGFLRYKPVSNSHSPISAFLNGEAIYEGCYDNCAIEIKKHNSPPILIKTNLSNSCDRMSLTYCPVNGYKETFKAAKTDFVFGNADEVTYLYDYVVAKLSYNDKRFTHTIDLRDPTCYNSEARFTLRLSDTISNLTAKGQYKRYYHFPLNVSRFLND